MAKISKLSMLPLILLTVCAINRQAQADTSVYIFGPDQSTVVKTGGFAGVNETYAVTGQFRLTIDSDAGVASFEIVDANLTDETGAEYGHSLEEIFNMIGLAGTIVDDMTIEFEGKTTDGIESDVNLTLILSNDSAHLTGKTTPPPNSADMFFYDVNAVAIRKYAGGTGEPNDPYQIATAEDLILLGETPDDYEKHFILTADIDLDPNLPGRKIFDRAVIAPDTGDMEYWFQGTSFIGDFDGNGYLVSNLHIQGGEYLGLFGKLDFGGNISNLGLEAVDVNGTGDYIGGLVGINDEGSINRNYCTDTSRIIGDECVGGLVGKNYGSITTSYCTGVVTGNSVVGGLLGSNNGSIANSYSAGTVTGNDYVGGFLGSNSTGSVTTSYCTGVVTGNSVVGGLLGYNNGSIANSYSAGTVNGEKTIGGLVGINRGHVSSSYSTSQVSGYEDVGGLMGIGDRWNVTGCFWDTQTSGQNTSSGGTGITTEEMQVIDTFLNVGWDFVDEIFNGTCEYWQISSGDYPMLRYHFDYSPVMPEGLGTAEQPYLIRDARDLGTMWFEPMAHYRLEESVDLSGITWPMAVVPWFKGIFDGNGNTISSLNIQGSGYLGLFGRFGSGSMISNMYLKAVDINGTSDYVGSLIGYVEPGAIIKGCHVDRVSVLGDARVGGLIGENHGESIFSCYVSNANVIGDSHTGGLIGDNYGAKITACYVEAGDVSGDNHIGGLVGKNDGEKIIRCYSNISVSGSQFAVGGVVGSNSQRGMISVCYSTGPVKGDLYVGGLVGDNRGTITDCNSLSLVSGRESIGGLVGTSPNTFKAISDCFSTGNVEGLEHVGGLVGDAECTITGSYSTGTVSGSDFVGGLVGNHFGGAVSKINRCFSKSDVLGSSFVGGLVGLTSNSEITKCYSGGDIKGSDDVGCLVGSNSGKITDCNTTGDITGINNVGGLVGSHGPGTITNSYSTANLIGTNTVGGLVGFNYHASITTSYSTGTIKGEDDVGGLAGNNLNGMISNSYSNCIVTGNDHVGGLVGRHSGGTITSSYSTANLTGASTVGGLVGGNFHGSITTSYSTVTVNGEDVVGGLVGDNNGSINMCYSTGIVTGGRNDTGGLVGWNHSDGNVTASFWDIQTSVQDWSDGGTGLTTSEMQIASTFLETGWDFVGEIENGTEDIWWILEGQDYPRHSWEAHD